MTKNSAGQHHRTQCIGHQKWPLPVPYVDVHYLPNQWSFVKVIVPNSHNHWFPINSKINQINKIKNCWFLIQHILWSLSITWHNPQAASKTFSSLAVTLLRSCTIPPEFVGIMRIHKKGSCVGWSQWFHLYWVRWGHESSGEMKRNSWGVEIFRQPHLPSQGDSQGWRLLPY